MCINDNRIWELIAKNLADEATSHEIAVISKWRSDSNTNEATFQKLLTIWQQKTIFNAKKAYSKLQVKTSKQNSK